VSEIENAVRLAGLELRSQAERLSRRKDELEDMERALGWDDSLLMVAPIDEAMKFRRQLVLLLLSRGITLLCLLFNPVLLWIALPSTIAGVLIWALLACWHLLP
jgi:hypothetical protein